MVHMVMRVEMRQWQAMNSASVDLSADLDLNRISFLCREMVVARTWQMLKPTILIAETRATLYRIRQWLAFRQNHMKAD